MTTHRHPAATQASLHTSSNPPLRLHNSSQQIERHDDGEGNPQSPSLPPRYPPQRLAHPIILAEGNAMHIESGTLHLLAVHIPIHQ